MDSKLLLGVFLGGIIVLAFWPYWGNDDKFFLAQGTQLQNLFCNISIPGQNQVICDTSSDTFTLNSTNSNLIITTNNSTDTIFFNSTLGDPAAHISDPSGGIVIDSQARTAINSILDLLEEKGLMEP